MARKPALPIYIRPMLAQSGQPFDSDEYLFEVKWDGTRALAFVEDGGYRLVNRRQIDMTERYPEFEFLADLPPGTVLDGEIVVLDGGKPDFNRLLSREQSRSPLRIRSMAKTMPATYIVFDQLFQDHRSLLNKPLLERRSRLAETVRRSRSKSRLVFSEGVVGAGEAFFQQVADQGLEGVVAKRMSSRYLPGKRTSAWIKIKRTNRICCAIIGFLPAGKDDFRSLILASDDDAGLQLIGKVGTGFDQKLRDRINSLLWGQLQDRPMIHCRERAKWVEPGLYCWVSYLERTKNGELRAPVFESLELG